MSSERLSIFSADNHGRVVAEIALTSGWEAVVFNNSNFSKNTLVDSHLVISYLGNLVSDGQNYQGFRFAVGADSAIGAGSVVINNVPDDVT